MNTPAAAVFYRMIAVFLISSSLAVAAEPSKPAADEPLKAVAYRILPTDRLGISVAGEPEVTVSKRVDVNGNLTLQYLTKDVHVAGFTIKEAQAVVENAYREERIYREPKVSITVEDYAERSVSVSGFVRNGGKVPIPPETIMTLKDVIVKCGGFTDTANGKNVKVTRTMPDGSTKLWEHLDVESLILGKVSGKTPASTFIVEPGDSVYVPERII
jgi:polysaccharide export outer membrane protein